MISIDSQDAPTLKLDDEEAALMDEISIAPPEKKIPIKAKPVRTVPRFAPRAPAPAPAAPPSSPSVARC